MSIIFYLERQDEAVLKLLKIPTFPIGTQHPHPPSRTIGLIVEGQGQKEPGQHSQLRPQEMLLQRLSDFITGMSYCLVDEVHKWELLDLNQNKVTQQTRTFIFSLLMRQMFFQLSY